MAGEQAAPRLGHSDARHRGATTVRDEAQLVEELLSDEHNNLKTEVGFLASNVRDIVDLRNAAAHIPLRLEDLAAIGAANKGALGIAINTGRADLANKQLSAWATYFSRHIDNLLEMYSLLGEGQIKDPRVVRVAFDMSSDIINALDRTIAARILSDAA